MNFYSAFTMDIMNFCLFLSWTEWKKNASIWDLGENSWDSFKNYFAKIMITKKEFTLIFIITSNSYWYSHTLVTLVTRNTEGTLNHNEITFTVHFCYTELPSSLNYTELPSSSHHKEITSTVLLLHWITIESELHWITIAGTGHWFIVSFSGTTRQVGTCPSDWLWTFSIITRLPNVRPKILHLPPFWSWRRPITIRHTKFH